MIVKYRWMSAKKIKKKLWRTGAIGGGGQLKPIAYIECHWSGWFLFGLIPLYVRCDEFAYYR